MAKKMTRRKTNRPKVSPAQQRALATWRQLESARNLQRKIRRLTGELQRAIIAADDGLRMIGRIAIERDLPHSAVAGDGDEDQEPAAVGAVHDARD